MAELSRTGKVDFTGVQWTMLVTLYLRALDSRSKRPILGDHAADEAILRIDYNFNSWWTRLAAGDRHLVALRAKQLEDWALAFLNEHPEATVLQLACGLDSRAFRLGLPSAATWIDVDFPEVIKLRRELYDEHDRYRMIGSSVTEPDWLEQVPSDRPTLVIAEGLLMYLAPEDVRQLLGRTADRFPSGALVFDGLKPWAVWSSNHLSGRWGNFKMSWAIEDGKDAQRLEPRLAFQESVGIAEHPELIDNPLYRAVYSGMKRFPAVRDSMLLCRYEF